MYDAEVDEIVTVGVFIPVFKAAGQLPALLGALAQGTCPVRILIGECASSDATSTLADTFGAGLMHISPESFDHGLTREEGRRHLGTDIVVMMTQDAHPANERTIELLIQPILRGEASVSYARQVARPEAGFIEAFRRKFNYPEEGQLRGIEDAARFGFSTFFCSNSCAAYLSSALDSIGGFRRILSHEDFYTTARLLAAGHKIAYVAESVVVHSHCWTLMQEFRRAFDAGHVLTDHPWVAQIVGGAEHRGIQFVGACLRSAWNGHKRHLPYILAQSCVRWFGYRTGYNGASLLPSTLKQRFSSQPGYFARVHSAPGETHPILPLEVPQSTEG